MQKAPALGTTNAGAEDASDVSVKGNGMGDDCHYEVILPKTSEGFMLRLGASPFLGYHASFSSYRRHSSGAKSFVETQQLFRNADDVFIKIEGVDMLGKSFDEVLQFIAEKSLCQDSLRVLLLDVRAYEASRANQVSLAPKDTTLDRSKVVPDKATDVMLRSEDCDDALSLNKEDDCFLQNAIEEDLCGPIGSAEKEKTPSAMNSSGGTDNFYDVRLSKTPEGFMFLLHPVPDRIGNGYTTSFYGYHRHRDGSLSEAEKNLVFKNIGDILISVNGEDLKGIPPGGVFSIIKGIKDKRNSINLRLTDAGASLSKRGSPILYASKHKTVAKISKSQRRRGPTDNNLISGHDEVNSNALINPLSYRSQSQPASLKQMVENIPAPEPELVGLGWIRQGFTRIVDPGHIDRYWITPVTHKKLRSRVEVTKFLAFLETTKGDEEEAFRLLKREYSSRKGRRRSVGKSSERKNNEQLSISDKNVDSSLGKGGNKLGELLMEQGVQQDLSNEKAAGAVEDYLSIDSSLCTKSGATLTPSIVPFEGKVEDQKIAADGAKEVSYLSTVTNTMSNNNIYTTASEVPAEKVIGDKMTNVAEEGSALSSVVNPMSNDTIFFSSSKAPVEQAVEGNVTKDVSSLCTVTITGNTAIEVNTEQEGGHELSDDKITTDESEVVANISAISYAQNDEAASTRRSKMYQEAVKPCVKENYESQDLYERKEGEPEDRFQRESTALYSGFELSNSSSLISIDLENLTLTSPGKNVSVPIITAEPVSICSNKELRKMPVAFAFELNDEESARNAKAAQILWYSSLLSESQRRGYIEQNVFQGAQRKRNSVAKAPRAAKKQQEDESESCKRKKQITSQGTQAKRKLEAKAPSPAEIPRRANKRKKLKPTPTYVPTSSSQMKHAMLIEDIPAPEPELSGWTRKSYKRKSNQSHIDRYWFTPKAGIRLRSRPECLEFLKHLEGFNGDELKAYESFRNARG